MPLAAALDSAFFSVLSTALLDITLAAASAAAGPLVSPLDFSASFEALGWEDASGVPIERTLVLGADAEEEELAPPIERTLALGGAALEGFGEDGAAA